MPFHEYVKQIYQEVNDQLYIIRFLTYLINTRHKKVLFTVNGITVEPLINGILEDKKSKKQFYSIVEFYNYAYDTNFRKSDINILSKVFVIPEYSIMRIICNVTESYILNFFDQKYRAFLMYRNIQEHLKNNLLNSIGLHWNNYDFVLNSTELLCQDATVALNLLELFEDGEIKDLYSIIKDIDI